MGGKEGSNSRIHQSFSQNGSGDLRSVAGRDGMLGCLCGISTGMCVGA